MAATKTKIRMKKTKQSFTCILCGAVHNSPQGISAHVRHHHRESMEKGYVDNKGRLTEAYTGSISSPDTKGKITAVPSQPDPRETIEAFQNVNAATEPFHYAILRDFEAAAFRFAGKDVGPSELIEEINSEYDRAKRLLAIRILLLKTRADMADMLERELLS